MTIRIDDTGQTNELKAIIREAIQEELSSYRPAYDYFTDYMQSMPTVTGRDVIRIWGYALDHLEAIKRWEKEG